MTVGARIVRNSLFGIASQAIGGGSFFLATLLIARHLGPDRFGAFSFVFACVAVFHMLADFGLTNILIREISRHKLKVAEILGAVIPLVTCLALAAYVFIVLLVQFLPILPDAEQAMYIMGATVLLTFHAAVYGSVCRAFEEMGYNAVGLVAQRAVLLLLILLALNLEAGLPGIALCYLGERIFQWLFFYVVVRRRYSRYRWRYDTAYWRYLIREGLPVGAGMVLRRISWYVDTFILMALSSASSVGLFSAAYRVIQMVNVIPFTLSVPLFPALTQLATESADKSFLLFVRAQKIFMLIGLPIGLWMMLLGPQLILLLFGENYHAAGTTLRIMGLVVVFLFLNSLYLYLFSALGKQKLYMNSVAISVGINIVLDLLLIPVMDIQGAALATLCSELVLNLSSVVMLSRLGHSMVFAEFALKPLLAVLLAGSVLIWPVFSQTFPSLLLGSSGFAIFYLALTFSLKVLTRDEMDAFRATLTRRGKAKDTGASDVSNGS